MSPFANVDIFPELSGLPDFNSDPPPPFKGEEVVAGAHGWVSLCFSFSSYFQFLVKID